jgi:uncharacterized protein (DUF1330 family)
MKHYVVAELDVTDESWVPEYLENVTKLVEQSGGTYLARTSNVERFEGERDVPQLFVIIEFPSKEAAAAFYSSAEYQPYLEKRKAGASTQLVLVAGEDIARG